MCCVTAQSQWGFNLLDLKFMYFLAAPLRLCYILCSARAKRSAEVPRDEYSVRPTRAMRQTHTYREMGLVFA